MTRGSSLLDGSWAGERFLSMALCIVSILCIALYRTLVAFVLPLLAPSTMISGSDLTTLPFLVTRSVCTSAFALRVGVMRYRWRSAGSYIT